MSGRRRRDAAWQDALREQSGAVDTVANAAHGGEAAAAAVLRRGGRFATITGVPPEVPGAGRIANCYVRPDGAQLRDLAQMLGSRELRIDVAAVVTPADAAAALDAAVAATYAGAIVLQPGAH